VLVSCDQTDRAPLWRERPVLLAEIVSPSSDRIDRNEKLTAYSGIASVMEYLIVAQDAPIVEIRRRKTGWEPELVRMAGELALESVDLRIPVAELYRRIDVTRGD
jgi:Uma2 family endonuclease